MLISPGDRNLVAKDVPPETSSLGINKAHYAINLYTRLIDLRTENIKPD